MFSNVCVIVPILLIILLIAAGIRMVGKEQIMLVERFGKYRIAFQPGLHFIIPFIDVSKKIEWQTAPDTIKRIDCIPLTESVFELRNEHLFMKDGTNISVDLILSFQLTSPRAAAYGLTSIPRAMTKLLRTSLREIMHQLNWEQAPGARAEMNRLLLGQMQATFKPFGIEIKKLEVLAIENTDY